MRRFLVKLSRAVFNWPPRPGTFEEKSPLVTRFGRQYNLQNLVETGTYQGDMIEAQRGHFRNIVTIELGDQLYEAAVRRFAAFSHIRVLHGDSGKMLPEAMRLIEGPAVFWLDAHYSKGITARGDEETPILKELSLIAGRHQAGDVILIDDARHFGLHPGYPRLARVRKFAAEHWPNHSFKVETDVICIAPV